MDDYLIHNIQICLEDGQIILGEIFIQNGRIARISDEPIQNHTGSRLDGQGCLALPGFIDIHIHGAVGADFMDGEEEATMRIAAYLPQEGTTSFLATTLTHSPQRIQKSVKVNSRFMSDSMNYEGAEMLGIHLEGPFIHAEQAGAQPLEHIREPSVKLIKEWFGDQLTHLKIVTLAPELDTNFEMIQFLQKNSVISSAGHTKGTYADIEQAVQHGLSHLTHFTNAMSGLHHREIGVVGAGLMNDQLFCEVIADGIHLSDDMLKLIVKVIGPERLILITDSMRAKGLPDGNYTLADQNVQVVGSKATLENGALAGSLLKMIDAFKKIRNLSESTVEDLVKMTSKNAAKRLGVYDRKGSITVGKDADIVLLNHEFDVRYTFCKGRLRYSDD
ncbi:N-acetylglucosamine-6-phosphate deacetylase [Psychrobacillus sp. FSL H8-0483]|uniref:N-acetylglucosamine-6-phosphate deacetylase n=1 Tax=Psychrobacillus sp. FSL H8-0483 TaxID=2921389 RepID=UPI00315B2965